MAISDSEDSVKCTPPEITEAANEATLQLLPAKSKERYENAYKKFMCWYEAKNCKRISEKEVLAYIAEKSKVFKASTLWSEYSMLKATLSVHKDTDISKYCKVISFLKRHADGYQPKKSKILTKAEIEKFLLEAPDISYLMMKVALIFGISGALRRDELTKLTIDDIQDVSTALIIKLAETKTKTPRTFTIVQNANNPIDHLGLYRKYLSLRPSTITHRRFFVAYNNGRCNSQPVGRNTHGNLPFRIAEFLSLEDPKSYTGHCFRRSSATLLADAGADLTTVKRHGGWKSSTVAEGYIEDSIENKMAVSSKILAGPSIEPASVCQEITKTSPSIDPVSVYQEINKTIEISETNNKCLPSFSITTGNNCNININVNYK